MFKGRRIFAPSRSGPDPEVAELREKLKRTRNRMKRAEAALTSARASDHRSGVPKFFLVGEAKSGTSWLMRLLHSHPEMVCHGEGKLFDKGSRRTLHGVLVHSEPLQTWLTQNPWTWRDDDPKLGDILVACVDYLMAEKLSKDGRAKVVGDKSPFAGTGAVREIGALMPEARVIHMIRDGRDRAVSRMHHLWNRATDQGGVHELTPEELSKRDRYRQDPEAFLRSGEGIFTAARLGETARSWAENVRAARSDGSKLPGERYMEVRYEDLLADPVEKARGVMRFLGVASEEEIATRCVEAVTFERLANRSAGREDPTSFYRKGVSGDWKNVFTAEDGQIFKREAGDLLVELGYEVDHDW